MSFQFPIARLTTLVVAALAMTVATTTDTGASRQTQSPIFQFENRAWVNLHHFLYVLGRASAGLPDAARTAVANAPKDAASAPLSEADRKSVV